MYEGDTLATPDAAWADVLAHDLTGPFRMTRAVLPALIAGGGGSIVNVASIAGVIGFKQRIAYSAAKAGLIGADARPVGRPRRPGDPRQRRQPPARPSRR